MKFSKFTDLIPFPRLIIYFIILGFLPLFLVSYHYTQKKKEWERVSEYLISLQNLSETKVRKQYINTAVREAYKDVDQFYFDTYLESLCFLKKEREALEQLLQNPTFTGNEAAEKRYLFITGGANRLQFTEGSAHTSEGVQETTELLTRPVEVDAQDLKELLARIEGNRPNKPQLFITDFKLNRKAHQNGNEVFELNMKLIKREFQS